MEELQAIRKQVYEGLRSVRIVKGVLEGSPDLDAYKRYLLNARWYAQFSPVVMSLGGSRCVNSHPELARYLLHHAAEEQGHDGWALADLADLGVDEATALAARPVNACAALVGYVHYLAAFGNPIALYGWMYILEAVGKDLGSIVGDALSSGLDTGGRAVRFVAGHGVADADHAEELAEQISEHVKEAEDRAAVDEAARVVADLYLRMFREIGGETPEWR